MKFFKTFNFEAAHTLPDNPVVHGHSYRVTLWFETSARHPVALKEVEKLSWQLMRSVDHCYLNDRISEPTMEAIACYLLTRAKDLQSHQVIPVVLCGVDVDRPSLGIGVRA